MDTFINILPLESNKNLIIQTNWSNTEITIKLCDSTNDDSFTGHSGTVSLATFERSANELEIPFAEFMTENKRALTSDGGLPTFLYQFNADDWTFNWRKVKDSGVKIVYGSVNMTVCTEMRQQILLESIRKIREQSLCIDRQTEEFELFKVEHEKFRQAFDLLVESKNNLETDLLTKFTALLNRKKDKIRELEAAIKHFDDIDANRKESPNSYGAGSDTDMECGLAVAAVTNAETVPILPRRKKYAENQISMEPCSSKSAQQQQPKMDSPQPNAFECNTQQLFDDM